MNSRPRIGFLFACASLCWLSFTDKAAAQANEEPHIRGVSDLIDFTVSVEPKEVRRGTVARLTITGTPKTGYYTYTYTRKTKQQGGKVGRLEHGATSGVRPLQSIDESSNELKEYDDERYFVHKKPFTLSQDLLILPNAPVSTLQLPIKLKLMVCNHNGCTDGYINLKVPVFVSEESALALSPELAARPEQRSTQFDEQIEHSNGDLAGLLALMGSAFAGAFLMLLTPCVFPMIPITVNFFLKQSEKEHHRPFAMASCYSGTIIVVLSLAVLLLGKVIIDLANNPWFNLALGLVLVVFAFSLFGMYEIGLPGFLSRFTSAHEGRGGTIGAIFMALTFTITSFTCTGPFLALLMAPVAGLQPPFIHLLLAAIVYSATFAAPFFVLALFPMLLKRLPKSGGWLNSVKVAMGFVELAAALKFLANTDYFWSPGNPRIFTYDAVLCAWIALSAACALYLFGVFRLPHDMPVEHVGPLRMVIGTIFFGLALYMTPALWRVTPQGVIGDGIVAFLPPDFDAQSSDKKGPHLGWHLKYDDAWREAKATAKPIFIDFTGVNCTNCRQNEKTVFTRNEIHELLSKYVRVQLYTDTVPDAKLSPTQAETQAELNVRWRGEIADATNPNYVIFLPSAEKAFTADGALNGEVLARRKGTIYDVADFAAFLKQHAPAETAVAQQPMHKLSPHSLPDGK